MAHSVKISARFEKKNSMNDFLDDEQNNAFNRVCFGIMDGYFLENGSINEDARKKLICGIFNDVYSCATNIAVQQYTKEWGEHHVMYDTWYLLPDGTDFSKYTMYKHLPLFMPMLWWLLYFADKSPYTDLDKVEYEVRCRIKEKFNSPSELLIFERFDCAFGACEENVIKAIQTIANEIRTKRHWKGITDELRLISSYRNRIEREHPHRGGDHAENILKFIVEDIEQLTGKIKIYNSIKRVDDIYPSTQSRFREILTEMSGSQP